MSKLMGVVLCGGSSSRMGSDKGLLIKDSESWASIIAKKLLALELKVIISINKKQEESYQKKFPGLSLVIDDSVVDGPLDGILSSHRRYPDNDIFLMACDLIDMDESTINDLIDRYKKNPGFAYYAYRHEEFIQPFCAIYTAAALSDIYQKVKMGNLSNNSLHHQLETANTFYVEIDNLRAFKNYNRKED